MCGVVAILGVSCQLNRMTRTLLWVLKKKSSLINNAAVLLHKRQPSLRKKKYHSKDNTPNKLFK
jgi:hypothetical protein